MSTKTEAWQGTLAFMALKNLNAMAPARVRHRVPHRADSENLLSINHGFIALKGAKA
jgi:hypothetical protein